MNRPALRPTQVAIGVAGLAGIVAVAVLYWMFGAHKLDYVDLDRPAGFRAVLLDGASSTGDAFGDVLSGITVPGTQADVDLEPLNLCDALLRDPRSPAEGPNDAAVTIIEFTDYRCPYCRVLTQILSEVRREADVRIVYKDWPILGEPSHLAARAALGAASQGRYLKLHEKLMETRLTPTPAYVRDMAEGLGLDVDRLETDMSSDRVAAALRDNGRLARQLGLSGTPVLIVGRTIVEGAVTKTQLLQLIANETAETGPCQSPVTPQE